MNFHAAEARRGRKSGIVALVPHRHTTSRVGDFGEKKFYSRFYRGGNFVVASSS
jgi:hypothetical protein